MKYITQILVLCFSLSFVHSQTSTCFTGVATDDTSQALIPNNFEENQCPTDNGPQSCLRAEASIRTILLPTNVEVTFGLCVNDTTCMTDCERLISMLIEQSLEGVSGLGGLNLAQTPYRVITCERACCTTDNCNDQSVETILSTKPEMTTGVEPKTSQKVATTLESSTLGVLTSKPTTAPQTAPKATTIPQTAPKATTAPHTAPKATTAPQTTPKATTAPQTTPKATTAPQTTPDATTASKITATAPEATTGGAEGSFQMKKFLAVSFAILSMLVGSIV